jgi:hypothetical protein
MSGREILRYDPGFIEEAIFFTLRRRADSRAFHKERERVYEIAGAEERERLFQDLNLAWLKRLDLALPIEKAIDEQPLVPSKVKCCIVARAPAKKEQGAELFVSAETNLDERERRAVRLLLTPEFLLEAEPLLAFLRRELFHIADMLDPSFGYEPSLPGAAGGPAHESLLRDRYRALWDAAIDGRMARRGWLSPSARANALLSFARAFPFFGAETEPIFSGFFDREPHTHAELAGFACAPRSAVAPATPESCCPLCRFPTHAFEPEACDLPQNVVAEITRDFPSWRPSQGLCIQCADLYRASRLSAAAAMLLPGSVGNSPASRG